jgi:pyridoxal phosphate enzyme (YggS family)
LALTPDEVSANLADVQRRIEAAGGDPGRVVVVAVSKTFSADDVAVALEAGLRLFGENYATELLAKAAALDDTPARWHFLGALQTNKIARLAPVTACFQGVSRAREAAEIARRAPGASVMVQVDFTHREGRGGAAPGEVAALVETARSLELDVCGLMTVAPQGADEARQAFADTRRLADALELPERSMGMSEDLELAVAEGSTMVRIGRALFGPRQLRA